MRRFMLSAAALAAALGSPAWSASPKVGQPAPDFRVETFQGKPLTLADFRGQVVVLNFWATWCTPCRRELPLLDTFYRAHKSEGLSMMAIATEDSVPERYLKPLAAVLSFPLAHRMHGPYRIMGAVPTNFIIDRAGVVRYAQAAAFDQDTLKAVLEPLLNEPAPEASPPPTAVASATR
jgi:cytochrome c biogenesis protein CcmG, thiol:disulfide interchange protein DsbE